MNKNLYTLIILYLLYFIAKSDALWFMRNLTCTEIYQPLIGKPQCKSWNQTTKMYFYLDYFHLCFPEGTIVQTEKGPIPIENLQIGQRILSWNQKTGMRQFSTVIGWISRDPDAISSFTMIEDETANTYLMSPLHNIAIQHQQKYQYPQFMFANSLKQGDRLIYNSKQAASRVKLVKNSQQIQGLYAPITQNSNFFIYPYNHHNQIDIGSMVLAHCYSQIRNPSQYQSFITPLLYLASSFTDRGQQQYINPLYTKLRYLLGEDWRDQSQTVRYDMDQLMGWQQPANLLQNQAQSQSLEKGGSGGHSSSHSSAHSSSHTSTYTANRRRARKKTAVKLFSLLSIMKDAVFNV